MTWNIHHAEGMDKKIDVDRLAKLILSEHADVVALQEVDRGVQRSGKVDIITKLADLTGMTYAFGKTIDFQGGSYGNAFLTRYPIFEERNVLYTSIRKGEQRAVLLLLLDINGEEVSVANTHFDSSRDDSARISSASQLRDLLREHSSHPMIVCGDFNDTPDSRTIGTLREDFSDTWERVSTQSGFTFPSDSPRQRIDYVFTRREEQSDSTIGAMKLMPVAARVVRSSASDHLPLIVDFELTTER